MKRNRHTAFRKVDAELLARGRTIHPCKPKRINTEGMFPLAYMVGAIILVTIIVTGFWAFSS